MDKRIYASFEKETLAAVGKGLHTKIGVGRWAPEMEAGILFRYGSKGIYSEMVSLRYGIITITKENLKEFRDIVSQQILEEKKNLKNFQEYEELLNLSHTFLKKVDANPDEDLSIVRFYSNGIDCTLFGILSKDSLKIIRNFQPFNRYRALIEKKIDYVTIPLRDDPERVNRIKDKKSYRAALKTLKEEQERVIDAVKGYKERIEYHQDSNIMLDRIAKI